MQVKIKRIGTHTLPLPGFKSTGAAGMDLSACIEHPLCIQPGGFAAIPTGFAFEIPNGCEGQVRGRSGLAFNFGVISYNGTIDADYRGEVKALLFNCGVEDYWVTPGDRICQLVIAALPSFVPVSADDLTETERGAGGFGSTGAK